MHTKYLAAAAQFFALPPADPARRALYFDSSCPPSPTITATAGKRILEINQQNMVEANNEARAAEPRASRYMIVALIDRASSSPPASPMRWPARIVRPMQSLTESAQQLGEGNLDQHVPVQSSDEVGKLAEAFNKMAAKLRAYRQSTTRANPAGAANHRERAARLSRSDPGLFAGAQMQLQNAAAERFLKQIGGDRAFARRPLRRTIDQSLKGAADYQPTSFDKAHPGQPGRRGKILSCRASSPCAAKRGVPVGVVVALQDVTRFRVADDVKTDLIATVSHELKTPLTSMQMAVYLLLEEKIGPLNPKQTELLLAARNNSDRLFEMIEDLLDLARFEGGAALIEKKPVASQQLVEDMAEREHELVVSRGLELNIEIGAAPAAGRDQPRRASTRSSPISFPTR